jgi:nitrate reductase gamma subunit
MDYYELVRGPLAVLAFAVLIVGLLYRAADWLLVARSSKILYPGESVSGATRSLIHHLTPFGAEYMRKRPVFTVFTFLFHISVVILPVFLLAHTTLLFESYGVQWAVIPDKAADIMTLVVLSACVFFFLRRLMVKEVRAVSVFSDYLLPVIIFLCFLTGFLSTHQAGPYRPMLILHILSSEILIMMIPFSRLRHMIFFMFSRVYMGSEYGRLMEAKDW